MLYTKTHEFLLEQLEPGRASNMFVMSLSEDQLNGVNEKLISALYKTAMEKYNYIDFDDIAVSKGDITKFSGYQTMVDTQKLLRDLSEQAGIKRFAHLDEIDKAMHYLEANKVSFMKGFMNNENIVKVLYNTTVYSILAGTNLLISMYIEFAKTPGAILSVVITNEKEKKTKDYMLFRNLQDFNNACQSGEMDKLFAGSQDSKKFVGTIISAAVIGSLTFIAAMGIFMPVIRGLIYSVYDIRMSTSELLNHQAELLKLNAEMVKDGNTNTRLDKKKVVKSQIETAKKLERMSDKIAIKFADANKKGSKEINKKLPVSSMQGGDFTAAIQDDFGGGLI